MRIKDVDVKSVAREAVHEFVEDDLTGLASQTAYQLIFSLPPMMIFFAALSALVARYTGVDVFRRLLSSAQPVLPGPVFETLDLVLAGIRRNGGTGLLSIGFVLALWSASGAVGTMMRAFNRAYDIKENRPFIRQKLIAIGLTFGLAMLTIGAFVLFVFGERLGHWIAGQAGLSATFSTVWTLGRWPVIVVFVLLALAILYWAGPAIDKSFRWVSPGAVLATLLWLAATFGFSLYLRFSDPGNAYGALGALVVMLFFLYVSSLILLVGAELNAVLDKRLDPTVIRYRAEHSEQQTDRERVRMRAEALAAREGKMPVAVGLSAERRTRRGKGAGSKQPVPRRAATATVLVSLASLFIGALIGAFRRRGLRRA